MTSVLQFWGLKSVRLHVKLVGGQNDRMVALILLLTWYLSYDILRESIYVWIYVTSLKINPNILEIETDCI